MKIVGTTVYRVVWNGVYPVAIYDGAEGGSHYTWDLFTVTGSQSRTGQR